MADDLLLLRAGDHLLLRAGDRLTLRAGAVAYDAAIFQPRRPSSAEEITGVNWNAGLNRGLQFWHLFRNASTPHTTASLDQQHDMVRGHTGNVDGTLAQNVFTSPRRPGQLGSVIGYDGTNNHIDWGEISPGRIGTGDLTVAFWFFGGNGTQSAINRVVQYRGTGTFGTVPGWQICYNILSGVNMDVACGIDDGSASVAWSGFLIHPQAEWHHHVHTLKRDGNWTFYVDADVNSTLDISTVTGSANANSGRQLTFGHADVTHGQHLLGRLDDVRIYHRALSAGEVSALYRASATGYPDELLRRRTIAGGVQAAPPAPGTIPVLDEGMLVGGFAELAGGLA